MSASLGKVEGRVRKRKPVLAKCCLRASGWGREAQTMRITYTATARDKI